MLSGMEQLISDITDAAEARGMTPQALLRRSVGASWSLWGDWTSGKSTPTLATVDRIRAWMAANPPAEAGKVEAAE